MVLEALDYAIDNCDQELTYMNKVDDKGSLRDSNLIMKGRQRVLKACKYAIDNWNTELTYTHIVDGKSSNRKVKEFDGNEGCATWLRSINAFSRFEQSNEMDTINMAYMTSKGIARDFIKELFIGEPNISWVKLYFKLLIRFTQLTGTGGAIQGRTIKRLNAFEIRWIERKRTLSILARLDDK